MLKLSVAPEDIWGYFQKHKSNLGSEYHIVAEITDSDVTIQVLLTEEKGFPSLSVEKTGGGNISVKTLVHDCAISEDDCKNVARKIYNELEKYELSKEYSSPDYEINDVLEVVDIETPEDISDVDIEIIEEREAQLRSALRDFLKEAMGFEDSEDFEIDEEEETSLLEYIECLMHDIGYTFYRPRIVEIDGILKVVESMDDELI